ncbi:MAG: hypothetical protein HUU56_05950 [Bdellovibrionaceae bacterium]|nr:hypothetical protein [Pseudobdellovibrionaceae bacterium]
MKFRAFFFTLCLFSISAFANKKTICAMTINSEDEIQAFKNNLSANDFDFIELTANDKDPQTGWLKKSCESGIQCDVLVISGHFAGTFFGSSKKTLSLKELENSSCSDECSGILKKPKEVFLFGCNTLAGKQKDSRTPEQYLQVLLNDGFSLSQAQQVVAFRYSPLGGSFSTRMRNVFNQSPRIYGFNSISPLGKYSGPLVSNYLKKIKNDYFYDLDKASQAQNKNLLTVFKTTSLVQVEGINFSITNIDQSNTNSPVCFLSSNNKKNSRLDKLLWIEKLFSKGLGLELLMYVTDFINNEIKQKRWSKEETQVFLRIKYNEVLKEELLNLLNSKALWLERSKLDILSFMKALQWLTLKEIDFKVYSILNLNNTNFTKEDSLKVCSYDYQFSITSVYDFTNEQWRNPYFRNAIMCLTPSDHYPVWNKLNESDSFFN